MRHASRRVRPPSRPTRDRSVRSQVLHRYVSRYAQLVQLGILFWFYRDALLCENRLRMIRRLNPGVPIFGLYGGPLNEQAAYTKAASMMDDLWVFPDDMDTRWKWRNGDLVLSRWYAERGVTLAFDSVFLAQWDLVVTVPLKDLLPDLAPGEMLLSGVRPVREVEDWWLWTARRRPGGIRRVHGRRVGSLRRRRSTDVLSVHRVGAPSRVPGPIRGERATGARFPRVQDSGLCPKVRHSPCSRHLLPSMVAGGSGNVACAPH